MIGFLCPWTIRIESPGKGSVYCSGLGVFTQHVRLPVGTLLLELLDLLGSVRKLRAERHTFARWPFLLHA